MTTTITATTSEATTTPIAVDGYDADLQSRNIIHDLIEEGIAVALIAPRPRSGTLRLVYDDEADAFAALNMHKVRDAFTLERDDIAAVNMTYVIDGAVSISLNPSRTVWTVSVGYQEVTP